MPEEKRYVVNASEMFTAEKKRIDPETELGEGLFTPDDRISIVGEQEDDVLSDLVNLLGKQGFGNAGDVIEGQRRKNKFRIMLKQKVRNDSSDNRAVFIKQFRNREIPTMQHIANEYGSGNYIFQVQYEWIDPETLKRKTDWSTVHFSISDKIEPERRKYKRQQRIKEIQAAKERLRELSEEEYIEDQLGFGSGNKSGENTDPLEAGRRYIEDLRKANEALGFSPNMRNGTNWAELIPKVLGMVAPALPSLIGMLNDRSRYERERMDKFMMMMLSTKDQAQNQVMELLQKQSSGSNNIMEAMDMVARMVDFKKELSEEKETIIDKVMSLVEAAAPMIGPLLAMPAQKRNNNPLYRQAQNFMEQNPDIQAVKQDSELIEHITRNLDAKFQGDTQKTDAFLEAAGISRPATCSGTGEQVENQDSEQVEDGEFNEE